MRRGGAVTAVDKVLSYSPILYWPMAETTGTTISDESGNGINGTAVRDVSTMTTQAGPDGNTAPTFDGVNDYISGFAAGLSPYLNESTGSALIWFKPFGAAFWTETTVRYLFNIQQFSTTRISIFKDNQVAARFWFEFINGSGVNQLTTGLSFTSWAMVSMTWNSAGNITYYLNNAITGTADAYPGTPSNWTLNNINTCVGAKSTSANFMSGGLSHFAVFDSELTLADIQDIYGAFSV